MNKQKISNNMDNAKNTINKIDLTFQIQMEHLKICLYHEPKSNSKFILSDLIYPLTTVGSSKKLIG